MKLERYGKNPILYPRPDVVWDASASFNCTVISGGDTYHMLYRALPVGIERFTTPWGKQGYHNFISSIGYAQSANGVDFKRFPEPLIKPSESYDQFGCEDPRVTKIGDTFYILYTAIDKPVYDVPTKEDRVVPKIALATTKDFKTVTKHGIVGPAITSKAAALFPEKINGKYAMLLTAQSDSPLSSILIAHFDTLDDLKHPPAAYWDTFMANASAHQVLAAPPNCKRGPETGAVPIKTEKGWLLIYCGEDYRLDGTKQWSISAALLDLQNPQRVIGKSKEPILKPEEPYELNGIVNNVTFPEGAVVIGEKLYVYYGGADKVCCLAICNFKELLDSLS